jgi:post-segregation antitoxin (ccd killing protein)
MLIAVPKTILISVCTPLVVIRFGASAQLVSSDLLSCHNDGGAEVSRERESARRDRTQQAKQTQWADPNKVAISQAAVGTVDSKYRTGGSIMAA